MMSDSDEIKPLYLAIGYVVVKWSFIEAALDFAVSTIYVDCGGSRLRKQMPKFLKEKCRFIAEAVVKIPVLHSYRKEAENLVGRVIRAKDIREDLAHSVLRLPTHSNGIYSFARLDAKMENHELKVWEFDVRNFKQISDTLENLAIDAQRFAKLLESDFHK